MNSLNSSEIYLIIFLSAAALSDLYGRTIPNKMIIVAAVTGALCFGTGFIVRSSLALALAALITARMGRAFIGGGDIKLLCILFGCLGAGILYVMLTAFGLAAVYGIILILTGKAVSKSRIPLAPFFLGGYICAELLQLLTVT